MNINQQLVTPELAQRWLDTNKTGFFKNRQVSAKKVEQFVKDIVEGKWQLTHQPIALYWDKVRKLYVLVDGQHRLAAIVAAGVAVTLQVAHYESRAQALDAVAAVDIGTVRSAADIAAMTNLCTDRNRDRAAAARSFHIICTGDDPSRTEVLSAISSTSSLFEAAHQTKWKSQFTTAAFMVAALAFGEDKIKRIASKIAIGEGLTSCEVSVQKTILDQSLSRKNSKLNNAVKTIRAIEACLKGQTLQKIPERSREEYIGKLLKTKR